MSRRELVGLIVGVGLLAGCALFGEVDVPRESTRAAVVVTAEALHASDEACARVAILRDDLALARRCASGYALGRASLLGVAAAVDAWDRADKGSTVCAVVEASRELVKIRDELVRVGAKAPPIVDDAQRLVAALGGCDGR